MYSYVRQMGVSVQCVQIVMVISVSLFHKETHIFKEKSDWGTLVPWINVENGTKLGFLL
jgi:hypothetical protein